ncbi:hypothetical protein EI546_15770 [Aequorivita sp. H23M31]|uniref:Uncharacterized protein n=1 Tax=Aequorivita ciconiae TaxID=2494375 RepID=A0A410G726_9FLAO|nr:hypothetical protein [Aequorivita sp. H23M31]QAA83083.1 hypothetical protein EI546_15770 [Aequorivita sp. H23M31]
MKKEEKKTDRISENNKEKRDTKNLSKLEKEKFPGYPHYPESEDIYNREKEVELNPEDLSKKKTTELPPEYGNQKRFLEDMTAEDLDVPGSKNDEALPNPGREDEENNYYSLGGDNHEDLEEDNG